MTEDDHAEITFNDHTITGWPATLIVIGFISGLFALGVLVGVLVS